LFWVGFAATVKAVFGEPIHTKSMPTSTKRRDINHPHICTLHDIGSYNGTDFIVMECLEGETLAQWLAKGVLPLEQVLKAGMEIADALGSAVK
jgi:serine/threonine protein kinase